MSPWWMWLQPLEREGSRTPSPNCSRRWRRASQGERFRSRIRCCKRRATTLVMDMGRPLFPVAASMAFGAHLGGAVADVPIPERCWGRGGGRGPPPGGRWRRTGRGSRRACAWKGGLSSGCGGCRCRLARRRGAGRRRGVSSAAAGWYNDGSLDVLLVGLFVSVSKSAVCPKGHPLPMAGGWGRGPIPPPPPPTGVRDFLPPGPAHLGICSAVGGCFSDVVGQDGGLIRYHPSSDPETAGCSRAIHRTGQTEQNDPFLN